MSRRRNRPRQVKHSMEYRGFFGEKRKMEWFENAAPGCGMWIGAGLVLLLLVRGC